ncbi:MAG TPA: DUF4384 domain-containing protein [Bryobacteraceae bacterium]|nr:DUF4384 domain-containing protein [Bryobacteraceae bacterium]
MILRLLALAALATCAFPQSRTFTQGSRRMEIMLEKLDSGSWHTIDPGLVLAQNDRVRFRFRTNFDGYLYVMNQSTSGKYEQLFPREETGQDNRIEAGKEYQVPATSTAFRITGPAGHETVYWLVTPARLNDAPPRYQPLPPPPKPGPVPPNLIPRCDDAILHARGDCVDTSAGPRLVPRGGEVPENLAGAAGHNQPELMFLRQKNTAVISSPTPLSGPVIYEFLLAHR